MSDHLITVCDDADFGEETWVEDLSDLQEREIIGDEFEIEKLTGDELNRAVEDLKSRASQADSANHSIPKNFQEVDDQASKIDRSSIAFIDFRLVDLESETSGEVVSYLARCYSECDLIVGVNRFGGGKVQFDLKAGVEREASSFADLNISSKVIAHPGLWSPDWDIEGYEYRPWSWPILPRALEKFERRLDNLKNDDNLQRTILDYLGFPETEYSTLPRWAAEALSETASDAREVSFKDLAQEVFEERFGSPLVKESYYRVAAARVTHWLEQTVLPHQNYLVDAPHLVSRFPSLIGSDIQEVDSWNNTCSLSSADTLGIDHKKIDDQKLDGSDVWMYRPVWFWDDVSQNEDILEVKEPWSREHPGFVFCENVSRFVDPDYEENIRKYVTEARGPFKDRYVKYINGINGNPIEYRPAVRFSL